MDSKHRHDLEQNDLLDFMTHFTQWWDKYGTFFLLTVLILAAIVFGKRFYDQRTATRHENAWSDLAMATSPEGYQRVAADFDDPVVTALANLRGADLLVKDVAVPQSVPDTKSGKGAATQPSADDARQKLDTAAKMYHEVVSHADVPLVFRLNAMLGLAAVAENRGEWKDADSWYGQVAEQAGSYTMISAQAAARRAMLNELQEKMAFAPAKPAPAPTPLTESTSQPSMLLR